MERESKERTTETVAWDEHNYLLLAWWWRKRTMSQGMWAVSKYCKRQENSPLKPPKRSETCFRLLNHSKVSEVKSLSRIQLFAAPWTVDYSPIAPPSMRFSRQGYWSGLTFPTPGDLPNPGIEPTSLETPALAGRFFTTWPTGKPCKCFTGI